MSANISGLCDHQAQKGPSGTHPIDHGFGGQGGLSMLLTWVCVWGPWAHLLHITFVDSSKTGRYIAGGLLDEHTTSFHSPVFPDFR